MSTATLQSAVQIVASTATVNNDDRIRDLCNAGIFNSGRDAEEYVRLERRHARGEKIHHEAAKYFDEQRKLVHQWERVQKCRATAIERQRAYESLVSKRNTEQSLLDSLRLKVAAVESALACEDCRIFDEWFVRDRAIDVAHGGTFLLGAVAARDFIQGKMIPKVQSVIDDLSKQIAAYEADTAPASTAAPSPRVAIQN